MEQVTGIEPVSRPWEGHVLPLNHTCQSTLVFPDNNSRLTCYLQSDWRTQLSLL